MNNYVKPEMEITEFEIEDVIRSSEIGNDEAPGDSFGDGDW